MADSQSPSNDPTTTTISSPIESNNNAATSSNFLASSASAPQAATSPLGVSTPLQGEELKQALIGRIEQVFTREWLSADITTFSKMSTDLSLPVAIVVDIPYIKSLTQDVAAVTDAIRLTSKVIFNEDTKTVKPTFKLERNTIILRDCPETTTADVRLASYTHLILF